MRLVLALAVGATLAPALAASPGAPTGADPDPPSPILNDTLEHERSGVEVPWSDAASGRSGKLRVERTFYRGQQPCRDFVWTHEAPGGGTAESRGTGCRAGNARWDIERQPAPPVPSSGSSTAKPPAPAAAGGDTTAAKPPPAEPPLPARKPAVLVITMPTRSEL
jgi:hypothetical protein